MIYVTHDQVEAMTMADRIVILRAGRVEQIGRPLELYNAPANRFVAGFIGAPQMNFLAGHLNDRRLSLDCGIERELPALTAPAGAVTIGVRPEVIGVVLDDSGDAQVEVRNFEQLGAVTYIYTVFPNGERLTVQLPEQIALTRGQHIGVLLPSDKLHVFDGETEQALV